MAAEGESVIGSGLQVDPVALERRLVRMEGRQEQQGLELKDIAKTQREWRDEFRKMNGLAKDTAAALAAHMDGDGHNTTISSLRTLEQDKHDRDVEAALRNRWWTMTMTVARPLLPWAAMVLVTWLVTGTPTPEGP